MGRETYTNKFQPSSHSKGDVAALHRIDIKPKSNIQKNPEMLQYKLADMTKFKNRMKTFSDKIIRDNNKGIN